MRRSSRFVVATHIVTLLAYSKDQAITSEYIAGSVNTNPVVVRRILALLSTAGLVATQEGAGGGVRLALNPKNISLRDVYCAVESDPLFSPHPKDPNPKCPVGSTIQSALATTLDNAETAIRKSLSNTTVADLVKRLGEN